METAFIPIANMQTERFVESITNPRCKDCKQKIETLANNYQNIIDGLLLKLAEHEQTR